MNFRPFKIILIVQKNVNHYSKVAQPLRNVKPKSKSEKTNNQYFVDSREIKAIGGQGGDGCTSFLNEWCNEFAGPDGGDGGNGGHVIFKASHAIKDLRHLSTVIKAENGAKGSNKDCHGKNATHTIVQVPVGTIVKNLKECTVSDLQSEGSLFLAARGGAGGKGNRFFVSATQQSPNVCEYGAQGETIDYTLEVSSIAHIGLVGFPNAGKSSLLRAMTRARPKVAPYPFTTIKPHVGTLLYDDYQQIAIADLPGLIENSHKNKGLGIQFLRHIERCCILLYVLDMSLDEPWEHLNILRDELKHYDDKLLERTHLVVANKIDILDNHIKVNELKEKTDLNVVPVSAKTGQNITELLKKLRQLYDGLEIKV